MKLSHALRIQRTQCVAIVGAGGKTSALFQLAEELSPTVITTTTHLGKWQTERASRHLINSPADEIKNALNNFSRGVLLISGALENERYSKMNDDTLFWIREAYKNIPLLIEADGARGKSLKSPDEHEPAIPSFADVVIVTVGLSTIGKMLNNDNVHRADQFSVHSGLKRGDVIGAEDIVRMLIHPDGGLKKIPQNARRVVLLNQADTDALQAIGASMAKDLLKSYDAVVVASLKSANVYAVYEKTAAIILAAGEAKRFGQPKQLLDFHGKTFIRAVTETALAAGLDPIIVVQGATDLRFAIHDASTSPSTSSRITIIQNEDWQNGQSTSIKKGLRALSELCGSGKRGVLFMLVDQPQITHTLLLALQEQHARTRAPITAPLIDGRRANPVLFDRDTFNDLLALHGDVGGRAIFDKHKVDYLEWLDENLLLDVDTPEDYQKLLSGMNKMKNISAIVLAAGKSERMGQNKLLLPWGKQTILGHVISVFSKADIADIVVVTGAWKSIIEEEINLNISSARTRHNPNYEHGGMLSSIQAGLSALGENIGAAFIALGDQPQIEAGLIRRLIHAQREDAIIAPSYKNRRGHPLLIPRYWWKEILELQTPLTLNDFLNNRSNEIIYIEANENVLKDLDTPQDYGLSERGFFEIDS